MGVTFDRLSSITTALNDSRADIKQILHVVPTVFQNFVNIYQLMQGAMSGIIALNNFADIQQWICSSIEAAARRGLDRVAKLCMQYVEPIIKNRIYNFLPFGLNPFVGPQARPNEITYSEERLRPDFVPPEPPAPPAAPRHCPPSRLRCPSRAGAGRRGPEPRSAGADGSAGAPLMRRAIVVVLSVASIAVLPGCAGWHGLNSLTLPGTAGGDRAPTPSRRSCPMW